MTASVLAGADVSHHQGVVNWHAVAEAGVTFAFAKATQGATFVDPQFSRNWAGMKDAGIIRGAYHFFRPAQSAESQIANFLDAVGTLGASDLPPVLDLEEATTPHGDEWDGVPPQNRISLVMTWLNGVASKLGRKPIVYTRRGFVELDLPAPDPLAQFPLWIAHYTTAPVPRMPPIWSKWTFWQYSETGTLDGIAGAVDLNRFNGATADLSALAGRTS
jgi:lysozyme